MHSAEQVEVFAPPPATRFLCQTGDQSIDDLVAGNLYVNVHTPAYPNGAVRGQLKEG